MNRPPPHLGFILGGMFLLQIFTAIALNSPSVIGPIMLLHFGMAPSLLGMFVAPILAGAMTSSLLAGTLVRRYGALRTSQGGALLMAAAMVLAASAQPALVLVAAALLGMGVGPLTPASTQLLAGVTPAHRLGLVFSLRQSGLPMGIGLMGILVPALLLITNWQGALLAMGVAVGLQALSLQPLRAVVDRDREPATPVRFAGLLKPMVAVWGEPSLRGLALCMVFFGGAMNVMLVYTVSYLTLELHYSLVEAGALFSVIQVVAMFTRVLWGWIADRLGDSLLVFGALGIGSAVFLAGFAAVGEGWSIWSVGALIGLGGATLGGWNGVFFAAIAQQVPMRLIGTVTGAVQVFGYFGAIIGPFVFALVISWTGKYASGLLLFSALILVAGLWILTRLRKSASAANLEL